MKSEALTHDVSSGCPAPKTNQLNTYMSLLPQGFIESNWWYQGVLSVMFTCVSVVMSPVTWSLTAPTLIKNKKEMPCSARPSVYPTVRDMPMPFTCLWNSATRLLLLLCEVPLSMIAILLSPLRRRTNKGSLSLSLFILSMVACDSVNTRHFQGNQGTLGGLNEFTEREIYI